MPPKMKKRLLYVEDLDTYSNTWVPRFQKMGYEVDLATNKKNAIAVFDKNPRQYAIAFVDLGLPNGDIQNQHAGASADDPIVGLELLEYIRKALPDIGLIAYSHLPENSFQISLIARLIANRISFAPIRFRINEEDVSRMLWFSERGFLVYPPGLAPMFKKVIVEPDAGNPLDEWEYYILSLRVTDKTLEEISDLTDIPIETLRTDFKSIYIKLEEAKIISEKEGERRTPLILRLAFPLLEKRYGHPNEVSRPRRRGRHIALQDTG